jgi:hypothetical protein
MISKEQQRAHFQSTADNAMDECIQAMDMGQYEKAFLAHGEHLDAMDALAQIG